MGRGQVAVEYLVVVALLLVIVGVAFIYATTTISYTSAFAKTQAAVSALANAADFAYLRGPNTKLFVDIELPPDISSALLAENTLGYTITQGGAPTEIWESTDAQLVGLLPTESGTHRVVVEMKADGTVRIGEDSGSGTAAALILTPSNTARTVESGVEEVIEFRLLNNSGIGLSGISYEASGSIADYITVNGLPSSLAAGAAGEFSATVLVGAEAGTFSGVLTVNSGQGLSDQAAISATVNQTLDTTTIYILTYSDPSYATLANSFVQGGVVYYKAVVGTLTVTDLNITIADPYNQSITRSDQIAIDGVHYGSYLLADNANTGIWNASGHTAEKGEASGSTSFTVVASGGIGGTEEEQPGAGAQIVPGYSSGNDTWVISRNPDFSTADTNYRLYDIMYVKVVSDNFSSNPIPSDPDDDPYEIIVRLNSGAGTINGHLSGSGDSNTYTGFVTFSSVDWNNEVATVEVSIDEYGSTFYGAQEIRIGNPIEELNFYSDAGYTNKINYDVYPGQKVYLEIKTDALHDKTVTQGGSNKYVIETVDSAGDDTSDGELGEWIDRSAVNTYRGYFTVPNYYTAPDWYVLHVSMRSSSGGYTYETRKSFHVAQNAGSRYRNISINPYQLSPGGKLDVNFDYSSINSGIATHYAVALSDDTAPSSQDYWIVGSADAQLHNLSAGVNGGVTGGAWAAARLSPAISSVIPTNYYYVILVVGDSSVSAPDNWDNYSRELLRIRVGENMSPNINNIGYAPLNPTASVQITISAVADDSMRGGSAISSCQLSIDGTAWLGMFAVDTKYDSAIEGVERNVGMLAPGTHYYNIRCTDAAANTSTSASQSLTVVSASGVVISEVLFSYTASVGEQWIELYNPTSGEINLTGYSVADSDESQLLPAAGIPAHRSMVIAKDAAAFAQKYGFGADYNSLSISLARASGDYLRLISGGTTVDFVAFNSPPGYAEWALAAGAGNTIRRQPIYSDTNLPADWLSNSSPQPVCTGG